MWRMIVIVLLSVALGACIVIPGQDPEELSHAGKSIQIGKSTKAEVLEVLGEPEWENTKDGSLYYWGKVFSGAFCGILPVGHAGMPILIPLPFCDPYPEDSWWLRVSFDENEIVTLVEIVAGTALGLTVATLGGGV